MELLSLIKVSIGALPFLFFISFFVLRYLKTGDFIPSLLEAFLSWIAATYLCSELLSWANLLEYRAILIFWTAAVTALILSLIKVRKQSLPCRIPLSPYSVLLIFILGVTFFIAATAAPNNYDSQTYHLSRIEHWIQNGSLEHYPTSIPRQIAYGPLAEMLIMHSRILAGSYVFSQFIQWLSMCVSLAGVFGITRRMGGTQFQCWLACAFVITIPIGILESTTTQNDYVVAALLSIFVYFGLGLAESSSDSLRLSATAWAALALSGIVKPTAYLIGSGFAAWFCFAMFLRSPGRAFISGLVGLLLLALAFTPFAIRNYQTFGSVTSPIASVTSSGSYGLRQTLINSILHFGINLSTDIPEVNKFTTAAITGLVTKLGFEAVSSDIVMTGTTFSISSGPARYHEDTAPNPLHAILIAAAFFIFVIRAWKSPNWLEIFYWCSFFVGAICFVTVLRWQPWITRLQLPLFVLAAPVCSLQVARRVQCKSFSCATAVIFFFAGFDTLFFNAGRPLFSSGQEISYLKKTSAERLFLNKPGWLQGYQEVTSLVTKRGLSQIGLLLSGDDWEYPFWYFLNSSPGALRIEHICLAEGACNWPRGAFRPQIILSTKRKPPEIIALGGVVFNRQGSLGPISIFSDHERLALPHLIEIDIPNGLYENRQLETGWSFPESWGIWTIAPEAKIRIQNNLQAPILTVEGRSIAAPGKQDRSVIQMAINGRSMPDLIFEPADQTQKFSFKIPPDILNRQREIVLTFRVPEPVCPNKFGSSDTRCLGFGLIRIGFAKK